MSKICLSVLIFAVIFISGCISQPTGQIATQETFTVSRVIDGDTIELADGTRVRLIGINAPEKGQFYNKEATSRLKELLEGKQIVLERDATDKDQYGRLLRYVYVGGAFVNLQMVKEGFANSYFIPPNTKYIAEFEKAEEEARDAKIGIWQSSNISCIGILFFHWDAEGNDNYNLNDEYVTFRNSCSYSIGMGRWTVRDIAAHIYVFSDFSLATGSSATLHTGSGTDTVSDLYWNNDRAIWNNDGDTIFLNDDSGNLVLEYSYP